MSSATFNARVQAYKRAFDGATPGAWWARMLSRVPGARRIIQWTLSDRTWMSVVLADLERFCRARSDQTTFLADDPNGRLQAYAEGLRQGYLRLRASMDITPEEQRRALTLLEREETEDQIHAA